METKIMRDALASCEAAGVPIEETFVDYFDVSLERSAVLSLSEASNPVIHGLVQVHLNEWDASGGLEREELVAAVPADLCGPLVKAWIDARTVGDW